jgi:hypothetical protein
MRFRKKSLPTIQEIPGLGDADQQVMERLAESTTRSGALEQGLEGWRKRGARPVSKSAAQITYDASDSVTSLEVTARRAVTAAVR